MAVEVEHKDLSPNIFSLRAWVKNVIPQDLKSTFNNLLKETRYNVLNYSEHYFPVQGYTAIWLLAESHLAIHTFPNAGWTYIELSGCNEQKTEMFRTLLNKSAFEIDWEESQPTQSFPTISSNAVKTV